MDDAEIVTHINRLVLDYRILERQPHGLGLSAEQEKTLVDLQTEIDQSWDLLRQRRARRNAGHDPDDGWRPDPNRRGPSHRLAP